MTQQELDEIIAIKDKHKRHGKLLKMGFFEADKNSATKDISLANIVLSGIKCESTNIWGKKEEYSLFGACLNCNGFELVWIEYLQANKSLTERLPKGIWLYARAVN